MSAASEPHRTLIAHPLSPGRLVAAMAGLAVVCALAGLAAGSEGWSLAWRDEWVLVSSIRAPRTMGAWLAGGLLGLSGAIAQGLFRNPLADPFLLGTAAGAGFGVTLVLAAQGTLGVALGVGATGWLQQTGLVVAAFIGAMAGVGLTLSLAGGAGRPMVLLLAGVVVGVMLGALSDLVTTLSPQALRGRQLFLLGTTGFLGWESVAVMASALIVTLPVAMRFARALDALVLGEAGAASLGLDLPRVRLLMVALMAAATGAAVAQAGLVAFVGLAAPHLVRRLVPVTHGALLGLSAMAGGVLLLIADVLARSLIAPQEVPVGVLTAVFGGAYLLWLLRRQAGP